MRCCLLVIVSAFTLTGCSIFSTTPGPVDPKDAAGNAVGRADLVLRGQGVQKFQCSSDKAGYWWRFIAPEAILVNKNGRKICTQGADFNFTAPDNSKLASKIISSAPGKTKHDLKDVLFAVKTAGRVKKGTLTSYRWVKRDEARGGIPRNGMVPAETCNRTTLGNLLAVPFSARYTFYKDAPAK